VVAYNGQSTPGVDNILARTLRADPDYRLASTVTSSNDNGVYYVWVRR
jgi:hypothetical protein